MNKTTVYIKGSPGFKPAVITKLGREWIHSARDISEDTISFALPDGVILEEFKEAIGSDVVSDFTILFLDRQPSDLPADAQRKFVPDYPFKMTIWKSNDSALREEAKPVKTR